MIIRGNGRDPAVAQSWIPMHCKTGYDMHFYRSIESNRLIFLELYYFRACLCALALLPDGLSPQFDRVVLSRLIKVCLRE